MTQNVDDVSDLNDFNEVENRQLRSYNRGAVLANIYDKHFKNTKQIKVTSFADMLGEISAYLDKIPDNEKGEAQSEMILHLRKRGYHV